MYFNIMSAIVVTFTLVALCRDTLGTYVYDKPGCYVHETSGMCGTCSGGCWPYFSQQSCGECKRCEPCHDHTIPNQACQCGLGCPVGKYGVLCMLDCPTGCRICEEMSGRCLEYCPEICHRGICDPITNACRGGCVNSMCGPHCNEVCTKANHAG